MDNKELSKLVHKFNTRIDRMYKYSDGSLPSIDIVRQELYMIYGSETEIPHVTIKGLSDGQKGKLINVMQSYIDNPESTITTYKAMLSKGLKTYANNHGLTTEGVVKLNSIFKSSSFNKLKELFYKSSDELMDNVNNMIATDMTADEIIKTMDDYMLSDKEMSFRDFVDERMESIKQKS